MQKLVPKNHAEAVAVFRGQVIGSLVHRTLTRGQLRSALVELSQQRFRPPGSQVLRGFSVPTLERWYYRWKRGGLEALEPRPRKDRGPGQALDEPTRQLVLEVRREHPSASAALIVRTLVAQGRLRQGAVSASTVRRLLAQAGLDRVSLRRSPGETARLRWEASHPGALWHGDVCHGLALPDGRPLRIHALMDDKSRYVVALEARCSEREEDMLSLFLAALRRWGRPDSLYLDNGSTYSGKALATACARLGTALVHARPYDPEARGKMEPSTRARPASPQARRCSGCASIRRMAAASAASSPGGTVSPLSSWRLTKGTPESSAVLMTGSPQAYRRDRGHVEGECWSAGAEEGR
jgi:transposase InsO family protein